MPAVLQEHQQQLVGALGVGVAQAVQDARGPVGAEAALAGAHAQAQRSGGRRRGSCPAAAGRPRSSVRRGISSHSQTSWSSAMSASRAGEARAEPVVLAVLGAGQRLAARCGRAACSPSCSHIASTTISAISR